jgi:hypothetical protein
MVCSLGNMSTITLHQEYDQLATNRGYPAHVASTLEADVLFVPLDCTGGRCRLIRSCALAANTEARFRKDLFALPPRFIVSLFIIQIGDALAFPWLWLQARNEDNDGSFPIHLRQPRSSSTHICPWWGGCSTCCSPMGLLEPRSRHATAPWRSWPTAPPAPSPPRCAGLKPMATSSAL